MMVPRPHSAMSNLASSADEYDIIDTIDEQDPAEWGYPISPFEFRDLDAQMSEEFGLFSRASSVSTVLTGNFGASRRRPASAMASAGGREETEEINARVIAAITRPRSAATLNKTAKCVEGLRNQVPSFQSACAVSKMAELAGKRGAKHMLHSVESSHKAWRSNITDITMLQDDLKVLDARSRLVSFRERATAQV